MSDDPYRLPRLALPRHYAMELEPDLESFRFEGRVAIDLEVLADTERLVLNAIELDVHSAELDGVAATRVVTDDETQRLEIGFDTPVGAGAHSLEITWAGTINDMLHGWYRSVYTDEDGVDQVIAVTQFEAADARRAFPCWDEPEYKATFGVTMVVPSHLTALSNGPETNREELGDGRSRITFADTMRMSTYLVALVVGPLDLTEPNDVNGVPVRIAHPHGKGHMTAWAEETAARYLDWLASYYGIPYPAEKVDHIAVPDFAFGAMENLGAIVYRETALLLDPATGGQHEKRRIADVVAHELAHMWFGDLVTMQWWEGIWLNEAFASFMEMKAVDAHRPDWERWLAFAADRGADRFDALIVDALTTTRPVEYEVHSPEEANDMFDPLTYGKGSAVLRMIEQFIGEEAFRDGVGAYLRKHAHANTVTSDLWEALAAATDHPVTDVMDTWILQAGYPRVDVERVEGGVRLRQRRFLFLDDETDTSLWMVPLQLRYRVDGEEHRTTHLLTTAEETLPLGDVDWIMANGGGHGFYRVNYAPDLLEALLEVVPDLDPLERFTLLDDVGSFLLSGDRRAAEWLALASQFSEEDRYQVWQMLIGHLSVLGNVMEPDAFRAAASSLLRPVYDDLGWDPRNEDDELTLALRGLVIAGLGIHADDPEIVEKALAEIEPVLTDPASRQADITKAVIDVAGSHADEGLFDRMAEAYPKAPTAQLQQRILANLASTRRPELAARVLDMAIDGDIRNQDATWVSARLLRNRHVRSAAWRHLRGRWAEAMEAFPPFTHRHFAEGLSGFFEPELAREVEAFFAETPMQTAKTTAAQHLELMRVHVGLWERERGTD
ncbi:MAG: M1 family metallopeptidase [Acidimicrobiia bacterium]|nr:MAG: M1 family metallopeptidase [Acidimicrobiia bacterium]